MLQQPLQGRRGTADPGGERGLRGGQLPDRRERALDRGGREVEERGDHRRGVHRAERGGPAAEVAAGDAAQADLLEGGEALGGEVGDGVHGFEEPPKGAGGVDQIGQRRTFLEGARGARGGGMRCRTGLMTTVAVTITLPPV